MKNNQTNQKEERPQVVMLLPQGASDLLFVSDSYPLRQRDFVSPPIQNEWESNAQRSEEHVERENVVREGVFGNGEDCQTIADGEERPSKRSVAIRLRPHEHNRGNRREQVRDNCQIESPLGHLLVFANSQPQAERQQAKHETSDLDSVWLRPPTMLFENKQGDEERVSEPEHRWPDVRFGTRTLVSEQEGEADQRPERPARQVRLHLALVGSDAVRDDARHHQQPRNHANRFCAQAAPPFFELKMCYCDQATMAQSFANKHSIFRTLRQGQRKIRTIAASSLGIYWIKNFSSPQFKTWFAPMFFPGSFAVLSGAASPPAFLAGVVPRRRRGGFALIQVSCTRKEIASQSSPPRSARRLARIVFSAQNGIRDFV